MSLEGGAKPLKVSIQLDQAWRDSFGPAPACSVQSQVIGSTLCPRRLATLLVGVMLLLLNFSRNS